MASAKKPRSGAANPPVELYGPEDGGWYSTRIHDWVGLCPALKDGHVRGYLVLRSLIIEKFKNPVRKLTLLDLCELIPSPTEGQPSSLTRVRDILAGLSAVGLVSTPDGLPLKTSSRASAASKPIRIRVNDLPADGYAGWRNTEDKLQCIVRKREEAAAQEAGRIPDPAEAEDEQGEGAGRIPDPAGRESDPGGQKSDPEPGGDQQEPDVPLVSTVGMSTGGDALAARSAGDGRSPSTTGSGAREIESGCAASSNDQHAPTHEAPQQHTKRGSGKAKHTRKQLDVARAVHALYPADLLHGRALPATGQQTPPLILVPTLTQAILDALAGDVPGADRTVEQLGARIQQRWNQHGWAEKFYAGEIDSLVGAAAAMVRPLKPSDRYGCANPRCEAGKDADTGQECHVCPERLAARKAARRRKDAVPPPRPQQVEPQLTPQCACGNPIAEDSSDALCPPCRLEADDAAETARLRAQIAARYGTAEQREAYCATAPF